MAEKLNFEHFNVFLVYIICQAWTSSMLIKVELSRTKTRVPLITIISSSLFQKF